MTIVPPAVKPARPYFSSGPCAKPPGWSPEKLQTESLGRSHRAKIGKSRLQLAIDLMREVLQVPDTHRIGIVPGSDTGAIEMAMWTMLGARPVTMMAWESFGEGWVTDVNKQLKLNATVMNAPYGEIPDLSAVDFSNDVVFTWNGTTSGARVPDGDRLATLVIGKLLHLQNLPDRLAHAQVTCRQQHHGNSCQNNPAKPLKNPIDITQLKWNDLFSRRCTGQFSHQALGPDRQHQGHG